MISINQQEFRTVLGNYATGIAVVTCRDGAGHAAAMTINSFASLSLNPPLVLWSIDKACDQAPSFAEASYYAINILADGQQALSRHFATPGRNKFSGIEHEAGLEGLPLLPGCCATLQCRIEHRIEAGDHIILIGEVLDMRRSEAKPLIVHAGQYRTLA